MSDFKNILVLCTGNICRSPLAEALFRRQLQVSHTWSAGLGALVGKPADPFSVAVAEQHGLDISQHRAQQLAGWMCQKADLVLVMDTGQKIALENQYPLARGKVYRLGEFGLRDIQDPYRQSLGVFEAVYADIAIGVDQWVHRIRKMTGSNRVAVRA